MKRRTKSLLIGCILAILCITNITYTFAEEFQIVSIQDDIPLQWQEKYGRYILDAKDIIGAETPAKPYVYLLERYLSLYGIRNIGSIEDITSWIQDELAKKGTVTEIPFNITQEEQIIEYLNTHANIGDLLFYRVNGLPDRCLIYLGNGQTILRQLDKYKLAKVPMSFSSDGVRNSSTGLFAFAHIWKETKEKVTHKIYFTTSESAVDFTGIHYTLYVKSDTNKYILCPDYIIVEQRPGVYTFWNGSEFGLPVDDWPYSPTIVLECYQNNTEGLPVRIKIDLNHYMEEKDEDVYIRIM